MNWRERQEEQRALMKELEYAYLKYPDTSLKELLHAIKLKIGADACKNDTQLLAYLRSTRRVRILP